VQIKSGDLGLQQINGADGQPMSEQQENDLRQLLGNRRVPVLYSTSEIQGLTTKGPFIQPRYKSTGFVFSDAEQQFESYTDYLRSRAQTAVYGLNQAEDGKYIYTSNPVMNLMPITLSPMPSMSDQVTATTGQELDATPPPVTTPSEMDDIYKSLLGEDEFNEDDFSFEVRQPTPQALELTFSNLQNLSNLAGNNHSGRTVQEVYDELRRKGHSHISLGRNPFRRCP
jgi:hypothetical protein